MRVILFGADFEENLGMAAIAASLEGAGHEVDVVPFNERGQVDTLVQRVMGARPGMVGLSMQFQHRAHEFLRLARELREAGFEGHITAGGHFPTLAYREVLTSQHGIDSIVLHDGEHTAVELAASLQSSLPIAEVPGLALLDEHGEAVRTKGRRLVADLDSLPLVKRYRAHTRHVGVPFIPISGGRGCWGACTYCSITSFYRDARSYGGGNTLRLRKPEHVAAEMALLSYSVGGSAVFCFHDENFLMPRPADTVERITRMRRALDEFGVGKVGFVGKCRPDCVTPSLAKKLRELGVVRLYVGIENASQHGADHLNRRTQTQTVRKALRALRDAGIFACYNLLIFEPETTLDDVRENVSFIREHANHPVNFCRAEPYHGTPLFEQLRRREALGGSYLGWDYRLRDDRAELLFRICAAVFRERNFAPQGVANRYMGIGYSISLLEHFYGDPEGRRARLARRASELTRGISRESADLLEEAIRLAETADLADQDRIARETALLGLRIATLDRVWHVALDELQRDMDVFASEVQAPPLRSKPTRKLREAVQSMAVVGWLAVGATGCGGESEGNDPVPPDAGVEASGDARDSGADIHVVDMVPPDGGIDQVADPLPPDAGIDQVADPLPEDAGIDQVDDPLPPDAGIDASLDQHWRDTTPRRAIRSRDLPLYDPPSIKVVASREGRTIRARLEGGPDALTIRWQSEGEVEGEGREIAWSPASEDDHLRVAVRSEGGVAIATLRAARCFVERST